MLDAIPREQIPAAIARLAARLLESAQAPAAADDEFLTQEEAATVLKTDRRWVYRHARELGAIRLSRRKLRLSAKWVRRYVGGRRA